MAGRSAQALSGAHRETQCLAAHVKICAPCPIKITANLSDIDINLPDRLTGI